MAKQIKKNVSHNRFGIVEKFKYRNAKDHPWISLDANEKDVAHVKIPADCVQSISDTNILVPYETEEAGLLERWFQLRFLSDVKEAEDAVTFTCNVHYLAGKLYAKGK